MFPDVAQEAHVELIPFLLDGVAGVAELNQPDGIHPNERGSVIVAANVWRALAPALQRLQSR
jgi:acyl-CoA thioesterase-1